VNRTPLLVLLSLLSALFGACGGGEAVHPDPQHANAPMPDARDPGYAASFNRGTDDPRVSTSAGAEGGIVLLWPRVVPADESGSLGELPAILQSDLRDIVERVGGGRPLDVRPEPQRACPQSGCLGTSIGIVLLQNGSGCAAAVTVSLPGQSPARLVPWAGALRLRNTMVPFREPPESQISVQDFGRCTELRGTAGEATAEIEQAVREGLRD